MKDISGTIEFKGKEYPMYFNLNVMEKIQDEYEIIRDIIDTWDYDSALGENSLMEQVENQMQKRSSLVLLK